MPSVAPVHMRSLVTLRSEHRRSLQAQAQAAAEPERFDEIMEEVLTNELTEKPAHWAKIWPSSIAISRVLHAEPALVAGRRVLELGAGLGLASISAAMAGAAEVCVCLCVCVGLPGSGHCVVTLCCVCICASVKEKREERIWNTGRGGKEKGRRDRGRETEGAHAAARRLLPPSPTGNRKRSRAHRPSFLRT